MGLTQKELKQLRETGKCVKRGHPELDAHLLIVKHIRKTYPGVHTIISPVIGGSMIERRDRIKHWGIMKAMGYEKGTPDIFIPVPRAEFHGMFLEVKPESGRSPDEAGNQARFIRDMISLGYCGVVCYGSEEGIKYVDKYMRSK